MLESIQPRLAAGEYEVTFSTMIDVLVAERGGPWGEVSPMRLEASTSTKARAR